MNTSSHNRAACIAVLPFENLFDDSQGNYFSLGFAEDIITDLSQDAHSSREWRIIEHADGSLAGFLSFHNEPESGGFGVHQMELSPETGYLQIMPGILRQLWDLATDKNQGKPPMDIKLYLGREHPAYQLLVKFHPAS